MAETFLLNMKYATCTNKESKNYKSKHSV